MKKLIIALTALSFVAIACGDDDDDPVTSSTTPNYVDVTCSASTDCGDDSADGATFYLSFINDTNCAGYMGQEDEGFIAGTVSCSSGTCTGSNSTTFFDDNDNTVSVPDSGSYSIYAFIDTNDNESPDTGEPAECFDSQTWDGDNIDITITADES